MALFHTSNEGQINLDDHNLPALNSLKKASKLLRNRFWRQQKDVEK
jgi:hypothetical protein